MGVRPAGIGENAVEHDGLGWLRQLVGMRPAWPGDGCASALLMRAQNEPALPVVGRSHEWVLGL